MSLIHLLIHTLFLSTNSGITFPTEEVILKHASLFEKTYVECFVDHYYASLPDMVQLSAIIVAYKRIYGQNDLDYRPINLRDYFLSEDEQDVPTDLVSQEAKKWFVLALPDATVSGLAHLKGRGKGGKWDQSQIQASIDLVRLVTLEAAKELSRIYEYQLAVVSDAASVQILGRHAAERSAEYLRSGNRFVERDSLIEGTAYLPAPSVSHRNSFGSSRSQSPGLGYVSAIFGDDREQRWEVSHVFASCGLRLDGGGPARSKSWPVFMTSREALPLVYGYRSPIFKKDFETGTENITQTELATYPEVLQDNPNDFHRDYVPLRIILSNRNSSFDSQSVCSLSTDPRRYDVESRNGRISRQSHTVVASHRVNGFIRNGTRTSTLVPSSRYGSMARSVEFDGDHHDGGSSQSRCFQRDMPIYQSERTPAVGGRFQKYSNNRPERITSVNGEAQSYERGTLRKAINGNVTTTLNRQMNGSISSLSRNPMMTMGGDRASPINGTLNHRMLPRHPSEYHYMANGHAGSLARLPPKPPIRSISTSQYNNHHNVAPSHFFSQTFVASPQTAPIQTTFTRLPPTTETSFDCNLEDLAELPKSAVPMNVKGQSDSSTPGFMDFNDFLKLVENQNANLKSQGPSRSSLTSKPATEGGNQLETDFPEVELRPESSAVMSNV